jgi:UDP-glucuronate decarboxylase
VKKTFNNLIKKWSIIVLFVLSPLQAIDQTHGCKTVLVTGGAGFLGSFLCERLIDNSHQVICIDDLSTGSLEKINHLLANPLFTFIQHDITEPLDLAIPLDEIYNFACPASPIHYQKDPIKTLKTNVLGALFVLELARKNNAKVFQASTSEVYGDPLIHPQVETYWGNVNPIGIRACYDEGKRCAETLFFDHYRTYGVRIKVGRIFNTYGPRMNVNDGRVVSNFIVQALKDDPITIYGKGDQTRSFCYVTDLIEAILTLMNTADDFTGPINLGNPTEFTILELATKIVKMTKSNSSISFQLLPQDDPQKRRPDVSLVTRTLNWSAKKSIEEGLVPTIAYFRDYLSKGTLP